jgi:peptide chain release factor 3
MVASPSRPGHAAPPVPLADMSALPDAVRIRAEAGRRRTFAIISHPDAGKTTLTEKLLLFGGAIEEAGAVKARRGGRSATSDWMKLEQERGISISSAALRFETRGLFFNLLDTPGHRDFSEDTYRVLSAADSAVMLLDAAKGIEPQTLKLFEVARERRIPLMTFVNKLDRPGRPPLELLDEVEKVLGLTPVPLTWPVGSHDTFEGVVDLRTNAFVRFTRGPGGRADDHADGDRDQLAGSPLPHVREALEEMELLDHVYPSFDHAAFLAGGVTPVFFGSALQSFGVRLLLEGLADLAPAPDARLALDGRRRPVDEEFSAFVFKVQANMDPRHRDRLAFLRICSGRFVPGMKVTNARTGRPQTLSFAHEVFGRERTGIAEAFPGDVVGLVNASDLRIGDTLFEGPTVAFPPLPVLAPEQFVTARNRDTTKYKRFRLGLDQLDQEGTVQVLRLPESGDQAPILAGVGTLQFEVAAHRLEHEFGAPPLLEPAPYTVARRTDAQGEHELRGVNGVRIAHRADGTRMALFPSEFHLRRITQDHPDVVLQTIVPG